MPMTHTPSPFGDCHAAQRFAVEHNLMPHQQIADRWYEMSGQRISRAMVFLVLRQAEEKIAKALGGAADDYFDAVSP